jgi:hypothetical protein
LHALSLWFGVTAETGEPVLRIFGKCSLKKEFDSILEYYSSYGYDPAPTNIQAGWMQQE